MENLVWLIEYYGDKIKKAEFNIRKEREFIIHYKDEIQKLGKELDNAKTTPEELGFEGNGVNCGDEQ